MNKFYVYALLDPRKPGEFYYEGLNICFLYEPFYIGYGQKQRVSAHFYPSSLKIKSRKSNKIKSIQNKGFKVIRTKLYEYLSFEDANIIEVDLIDRIGKKILMNEADGGSGCQGTIILKTRKSVDKVCMITLNVLETYVSITEAAKVNNTNISNISSCIRGSANTHKGFGWKYSSDIELSKSEVNIKVRVDMYHRKNGLIKTCDSISEMVKFSGIKSSKITRCCQMCVKFQGDYYFEYTDRKSDYDYSNRKATQFVKPVYIIDENNNRIDFSNINDCSKYLNVTPSYIGTICKGLKGKKNKYDIFYTNDRNYDNAKSEYKLSNNPSKIKIKQLDLEGNLIKIWNGISEAGYSASSIIQVCKGKRKSAYGFKWEYLTNKNNI